MAGVATAVGELSETGVAEGKRLLRIMDPDLGDLKIVWDPKIPSEVEHARSTFTKALKDKGMAAYRVKKGGEKAEVMREFDPDAEAMIVAPMIAGG
jgi:hypothetical protein